MHEESSDKKARRKPVAYIYHLLNWNFIRMMADIAGHAEQKYGRVENYTDSELEREKAPLNHLIEHFRQYINDEPYDRFDGDPLYHLAAVAYNAMMEFWYRCRRDHLNVKNGTEWRSGLPPEVEVIHVDSRNRGVQGEEKRHWGRWKPNRESPDDVLSAAAVWVKEELLRKQEERRRAEEVRRHHEEEHDRIVQECEGKSRPMPVEESERAKRELQYWQDLTEGADRRNRRRREDVGEVGRANEDAEGAD